MKTVKDLKNNNFRVEVYHARLFVNKNQDDFYLCMSRRDFGKKIEEDNQKLQNERFGYEKFELNNHGGATFVKLVSPDGKELKGKFNVPAGKQFDRKLGLREAITRALAVK